jgi:hypothetical protein
MGMWERYAAREREEGDASPSDGGTGRGGCKTISWRSRNMTRATQASPPYPSSTPHLRDKGGFTKIEDRREEGVLRI